MKLQNICIKILAVLFIFSLLFGVMVTAFVIFRIRGLIRKTPVTIETHTELSRVEITTELDNQQKLYLQQAQVLDTRNWKTREYESYRFKYPADWQWTYYGKIVAAEDACEDTHYFYSPDIEFSSVYLNDQEKLLPLNKKIEVHFGRRNRDKNDSKYQYIPIPEFTFEEDEYKVVAYLVSNGNDYIGIEAYIDHQTDLIKVVGLDMLSSLERVAIFKTVLTTIEFLSDEEWTKVQSSGVSSNNWVTHVLRSGQYKIKMPANWYFKKQDRQGYEPEYIISLSDGEIPLTELFISEDPMISIRCANQVCENNFGVAKIRFKDKTLDAFITRALLGCGDEAQLSYYSFIVYADKIFGPEAPPLSLSAKFQTLREGNMLAKMISTLWRGD